MNQPSPRRICFDIASNFYYSPLHVWLRGPNDARRHFIDHQFRFDAATAFNAVTHEFVDFTDFEHFYEFLLSADELISYNGRLCDLVVLESLIGEDHMKGIWSKPHHDLSGWQNIFPLKESIRHHLPNLVSRWDTELEDRRIKLSTSNREDFLVSRLADTYRDSFFTYQLFKKYLEGGERERTFLDLPGLLPLASLRNTQA